MTRPCWLRPAARNRHRHAVEHASRRWRGGTRRKILISTQADGASYVGYWKAGRMHGEGCYTDTDKVEWKGAFHNGSFFNGKAYATLR